MSVPDWMDADLVPVTGDNIVDRAARLLADHHGIDAKAEVSIAKSIPIAGGMAGGSADAAAALVALDRLWGVDTSDEDLLRIAAELGSDVPFALIGGTAIGTGRGELVEAVARRRDLVVGRRRQRRGDVDPGRLPPLRRAQPGRRRRSRRTPTTCSRRSTRATSTTWRRTSATTSRRPPSTCAPTCRTSSTSASARARSAASSPAPARPASSSPTSADAAREVAGAFTEDGHEVVLVTHGPVAGAHVVTYV